MADSPSHAEVLGRYCGAFVDELVAAGVEHVCLCPGSRSTPLALTFARHPQVKVWTHLDERSCAYFALGIAKAYRVDPVVILCSSGTAAANFAPAVIEAFHSHAPLIVLTADRPPELQDVGANQTIDQVRLYGPAVKWFMQMPLPEASDQVLRYVRMVARRSFQMAARSGAPGPVHLNFPFREPLMPAGWQPTLKVEAQAVKEAARRAAETARGAIEADTSESEEAPAVRDPHPGSIEDRFSRSARPLIVCGPDSYADLGAVRRLADSGVPILADALSDVRTCGPFFRPHIIGAYDNFLRSADLAASLRPDFILRFGEAPTSKPLATYLQMHQDVRQIVISPLGGWPDPDLTAAEVSHYDGYWEWESLSRLEVRRSPDWLDTWQRAEAATVAAIRHVIDRNAAPSEPSAVLDLAEVAPAGYTFFAGNSMPVRDIDSFWPASNKLAFFLHNRGASGIDGVVSTALGAAARSYGRLVLVVGDLSFYHDMNGLLAARRFGLSATIVLVNNDGGGIFSFLPQHDDPEHFEALFGTPHGLDFRPVAELYGVGFRRVATREEYRAALRASFDAPGVNIIEVKTDREANLRLHNDIWQAVAKAISPLPSGEG